MDLKKMYSVYFKPEDKMDWVLGVLSIIGIFLVLIIAYVFIFGPPAFVLDHLKK